MEHTDMLPGTKRRRVAWQAPAQANSPMSSQEYLIAPFMQINGIMRTRGSHGTKSHSIAAHLLEVDRHPLPSGTLANQDTYAARFECDKYTVTFWHEGNESCQGLLTTLVEEQGHDGPHYLWSQLPGIENGIRRSMKLGGNDFRLTVNVLRTFASISQHTLSSNGSWQENVSPSATPLEAPVKQSPSQNPLPSLESETVPLAQPSQPTKQMRVKASDYNETAYDLLQRVSTSRRSTTSSGS